MDDSFYDAVILATVVVFTFSVCRHVKSDLATFL